MDFPHLTLATGGSAIITSTSTDEDTFATIWKQAEQKFDEHGNEQDVGINGFNVQVGKNILTEMKTWRDAELGRICEEKFHVNMDVNS